MKKLLMASLALTLFTVCIALFQLASCKKASGQVSQTCPDATYQIAGLWIGTYTYQSQSPLYFSFTIYPDGTMSYKSLGSNSFTFYANGTWKLSGNAFSYTVTTTNTPNVPIQPTQTGTATYSNKGTLTGGINTDVATGSSGFWSMTRVN